LITSADEVYSTQKEDLWLLKISPLSYLDINSKNLDRKQPHCRAPTQQPTSIHSTLAIAAAAAREEQDLQRTLELDRTIKLCKLKHLSTYSIFKVSSPQNGLDLRH